MPVDELAALLRVVTLIADLDPATAWELDAQLDGLAKVATAFSEGLDTWGERLAEIGLNDSVVTPAGVSSTYLAQAAGSFTTARRNLRTTYATQFAAAEAQASRIQRQAFWGEAAAGPSAARRRQPSPQASPGAPARAKSPRPGLNWTGLYEDQKATVAAPDGDWSIEWYDDDHGSGWRATYLGPDKHSQAHCESLDEALDYIATYSRPTDSEGSH